MSKEEKKKSPKILDKGKGRNTFMIDPRLIEVEPGFNGRETFDRKKLDTLKAQVKQHGVKKPLEVRIIRGTDRFSLVDGERRWIVSNELINESGQAMRVPCYIFEGNEIDALDSMFLSNEGVGFNAVEEAKILKRYEVLGLTPEEIEQHTGRKKAYQRSMSRILSTTPEVQKKIASGLVSQTLVLERVMDESVSLEESFAAIEAVAAENAGTGKKVTKKAVDKKLGKVDSIAELKKVVKEMEKRKILDDPATDVLADFAKKLIGNKLSAEALESLFFPKKK